MPGISTHAGTSFPAMNAWERMHFLHKLAGERGIAEERLSLFPQHEVVVTCDPTMGAGRHARDCGHRQPVAAPVEPGGGMAALLERVG
jgi:hypothetical protein